MLGDSFDDVLRDELVDRHGRPSADEDLLEDAHLRDLPVGTHVLVEQADLDGDVLGQRVIGETELTVQLVVVGGWTRSELRGKDQPLDDGRQVARPDVPDVVQAVDVEGLDELVFVAEVAVGSGDLSVVAVVAPCRTDCPGLRETRAHPVGRRSNVRVGALSHLEFHGAGHVSSAPVALSEALRRVGQHVAGAGSTRGKNVCLMDSALGFTWGRSL